MANDSTIEARTNDLPTSAGETREAAVRSTVMRLKERFEEIDELALEAHLMLELTHGVLANMREATWTKSGVTGRRFPLLRLLYLADGHRLKMGTIAANLGIGTNNTTQLIDGMVREGLVQRTTDSEDKRVIYAVLTPHGASLFADFFPKNAERIRGAWSPLNDAEKKQLVSLLTRVRRSLLASRDEERTTGDTEAEAIERPPDRLPPVFRMSQPET